MDERQIEAFLAVVRHGRVSSAATALYLTQPALTARIQRLERDLGGALFTRTGRGMRPTAAGRAFLPFAERALETIEEGRQIVGTIASSGRSLLGIGAPPALGTHVLPGLLGRFARLHPHVELAVRTGHSEEVLELVLREEVEIGLLRALPHPEITAVPLYEDELVLVVPPDHRLAASGRATLADLADERLIVFDQRSSYHELTEALFRSARVVPASTLDMDNSEAAAKMVEHGLGVALLPAAGIGEALAARRLVQVTLAGVPPIRRSIVAVHRSDMPLSAAAQAFLAVATNRQPAPPIERFAGPRLENGPI